MTITTDLGEATLQEVNGIHQEDQASLKDLQEALNNILEAVTGISSGPSADAFIQKMGDTLKSTVGNEDAKEGDAKSGGNDDGGKPKIGLDIKPNDLGSLGANWVMGSLLVNSTLTKIQKQLDSIIKSVANAGNKSGGSITTGAKSKVKQESTTIENQTKIDLDPKKVSGLSKALLEFAKASILLTIIPSGIVKAGVKTFMIFIDKMQEAANRLTKSGKDFDQFASGIAKIVNAMKTYAIAVVLLALTLPLTPFAVLSILMLALMIKILGLVGASAKAIAPFIQEITKAMIMASIAFILFGIAALIAIKVGKQALEALKGLLVMLSFLLILVVLGIICLYVAPALVNMAGTFILLAIALILFGLAITIMSKIEIKQEVIDNFTKALTTLVTGFAKMIPMIVGGLVAVILLTLFSVLFFATMLLLTLGILCMIAITKLLSMVMEGKGEDAKSPAIEGIIAITKQIGENGITFFAAMLSMIPLTIFAALFLVTMLLLMLGVLFMFVVDNLLSNMMEVGEDGLTCRPINWIIAIVKDIGKNIGWFLLGAISLIPATVFAGLLLVFSLIMLVAATAMYGISKIADKMGTPRELGKIGQKLRAAGIGMMLNFLGIDYNGSGSVGFMTMIKAGVNAVKMAAVGLLALAAIAPMAAFMVSAALIGKSLVYLNDNMSNINFEMIERVFSMLGMIMNNLAHFASEMKDTSAKTIVAIGELVNSVADAVNKLVDIVIKLKDGIPEEQIDAATQAMNRICERLFGSPGMAKVPGQYTLTSTLETIAAADLQDLNAEACEAIVPLMDGIDRMCDIVLRLSDESIFSQQTIDTGAKNLQRFLDLMGAVALAMQFLVTKVPSGEKEKAGGLKGIFGGKEDVMKSPLDAINEVISKGLFDSMRTVFNGLGQMADVIGALDPSKMQDMVVFMAQGGIDKMAINAPKFGTAMGDFANGIKLLTAGKVNNFNSFINVLGAVDSANITKVVNTLSILSSASLKFKMVADSFDRMANALNKMAKNESKITKLFETMRKGSEEGAELADSAVGAVGGTTINPYVEKIYDVLSDWNTNGIPVRAQMDSTTGEITPIDAGNDTGRGNKR